MKSDTHQTIKQRPLATLWWLVRLQTRVGSFFSIWKAVFSVYQGAVSILFTYIGARLLTEITTIALKGGAPHEVYVWLVAMLVMSLIDSPLRSADALIDRRYSQKVDMLINELMIQKYYDLSQEQFDDEKFAVKLSRAEDALISMQRTLGEITWFCSTVIRFATAITTIAVVAPVIGIVILLTTIPVVRLKMKQNKALDKAYKDVQRYDRISNRTRWLLLDRGTMPEVRIMGAFHHLLTIWRDNIHTYNKRIYEVNKRGLFYDMLTEPMEPLVEFAANVYFFSRLIAGRLALSRFIFLRGLMQQASASATSMAMSFERLHEFSIDLGNFRDVFETAAALPNGTVEVDTPFTVEFDHVSFHYPHNDKLVLNDVSFIIFPGSQLALVGENGAGKSTIIRLLLREYLPTAGEIRVNGVPMSQVNQESYYAGISNLSQDFLTLYHLSVQDNLLMGLDPKAHYKNMKRVAGLVGATEFINELPHGYKQRLDNSYEDGSELSGGQLQRLGIARALLRNGDMLLLDEPTSAIDAKAEYDIFNNIYKEHAGRTTLIISHRFSTVRKAEKILVLERGRVIEYGSHQELVDFGGLYKDMFETQAEGYK